MNRLVKPFMCVMVDFFYKGNALGIHGQYDDGEDGGCPNAFREMLHDEIKKYISAWWAIG